MASKESGTQKKAALGSGSGDDDTKTAPRIMVGNPRPTGWVGKIGASRTAHVALRKEMGNTESSASSDCGSGSPGRENTVSPVVDVASPVEQSNAEVKADGSEGPAQQPMTLSGWARSSRVRDQIKFIEQMNKGSRPTAAPRRFVVRSTSVKLSEERPSLPVKRSAAPKQAIVENSSAPPASSGTLEVKTTKKSTLINALISQFEQKEQKVRLDERLEKVHLRRESVDEGSVTIPRTRPISAYTRKTSLEKLKEGEKERSPLEETPERQASELENTSLQESKPDTIINAEPPPRSMLPPKPGSLPPKEPKPDSSKVGQREVSPLAEDKRLDENRQECYPTSAPEVEAKSPIQTQPVPLPPAENLEEELYDDIDEQPTKALESDSKRSTMRDRPLPCVPDSTQEIQENGQNKNEKAGLFGRFKKMRKGVKVSKKDGSPSRKHKGKKGETVIRSSVEDDEEDALELKEEDELADDYLPMDLGSNHRPVDAGNTLEPEELYEDMNAVPDVNPVEDTEAIYLTPLPLTQSQQDDEEQVDFYDDVDVDVKVRAVTVKAPSPRVRPSMSPDAQSEHSSGDVYEDVIGQDDSDQSDPKAISVTSHRKIGLRQSSDPLVDRALQRADFALERSRTVPEDATSMDSSTLDVGIRNGHGPLAVVGDTEVVALADAIWDHFSMESDELTFRQGDVIAVTDMSYPEWWFGFTDGLIGLFPATFVRLRVHGTDESVQTHHQNRFSLIRKPKLTQKEVRAKVIDEILSTEELYVRHLGDITQGYLKRCKENEGLFMPELLQAVFSNVEDIYQFHCDFLKCLKKSVVEDQLEDSCVGHCFVENEERFQSYSEYCNNHPDAATQMAILQADMQYKFFFEGCRLLQKMDEISLEGYLLTPVQKICKYPLQLAELLKNTGVDHPDYPMVVQAKKAMANVAELINERKRRNENLQKIAQWQVKIEDWQGDDVISQSSELIHTGEIYKISKGHSQERVFFLFDGQLVYCKKELLGGHLQYRGRLYMDSCEASSLQDGEVTHNGSPVLNAWKMNNVKKKKWYVLYTKTPEDKERWLKAFMDERELAEKEKLGNLEVPNNKRRDIMTTAKTKKVSIVKPKNRSLRSGGDSFTDHTKLKGTGIKLPDPVSSEDFMDGNGNGKTKSKRQRGKMSKLFGGKK